MDKDIDKRKTAITTTINCTSKEKKIGELGYTNNKVLLSHIEPPRFNIALAIHVYDNAVAFRPREFAANEISTP